MTNTSADTFTSADRPARHELDLERFVRLTLGNLSNSYAALQPGRQSADFIPGILNVVGIKDDPSIESPVEIIMQFVSEADRVKGADWIASSPNGPVIVSCAYCLRALRAMKSNDLNLAWSYMADARYWCGVAVSGKGIDEAREKAGVEIKSEIGRTGATGRDRKFEPVRQFAYAMVREKRPPQKGWPSRAEAVKGVKDSTLHFAKEKGVSMSEDQADTTIDKWLKEMPDADVFFPKKKGVKKP